jgi:cell division protein FtsI/penicillin-binding protein 2
MDHIPYKANRCLYMIFIALLLISIRVSHLILYQKEKYEILARRPREKTFLETPFRGTISDRFGIPLAINRLKYNAAILYQPIREMARSERKAYIPRLSALLSQELNLDQREIEDKIYARSALFPHVPCLLKADLDEKTYYKLKALERSYPGLSAVKDTHRFYPQGKVGANTIGTLGPINEREYFEICAEMAELKEFLHQREAFEPVPLPKGFNHIEEVVERVEELTSKSYGMNTLIGKGGVEGQYEEPLRGKIGRKICEIAHSGQILRTVAIPSSPESGEKLSLSISSELQAFAENLLIENELMRHKSFALAGKNHDSVPNPWMKGGAIVAMIPSTGEVLTLASYPRFDPNAFIEKDESKIYSYLENKTYLKLLWDGWLPLERELPQGIEKRPLTYSLFLDCILSPNSSTKKAMQKVSTLRKGHALLWAAHTLLDLSDQPNMSTLIDSLYQDVPSRLKTPEVAVLETMKALSQHEEQVRELKEKLDFFFAPLMYNNDKLLVLDLLKLLIVEERWSPELLEEYGDLSLDAYFSLMQEGAKQKKTHYQAMKAFFHEEVFPTWRETEFASFLKQKRKEEGRYQRPYLDYLKEAEISEFATWYASLPEPPLADIIQTTRTFDELTEPLYGSYRKKEQDLASAFYPKEGFSYLTSYAFQKDAPVGSLFKVMTSYTALMEQRKKSSELNPLTIRDEGHVSQQVLGFHADGTPIRRQYKGGRLPSTHKPIGRIDLKKALQKSSNIYFSLLATDVIDSPTDILEAAENFGYGHKTGIDLSGECAGHLPTDLRHNRSGLYSFAIGHHTLTATPLQAAVMLSTLINGGIRYTPRVVQSEAPSFNTVECPDEVREYLLDALKLVVVDPEGGAHPSRIRTLYEDPNLRRDYLSTYLSMMGKTSSAEVSYRPCLNQESATILCKDIWFGAISSDLVVVVYLRFGDFGKEAAPLAAQVIKKWREISHRPLEPLY